MSAPKSRSRTYWLRLLRFALLALGLALTGLLVGLLWVQLQILTRAVRLPLTQTPADFGLPYESITLTTADGLKIAAWRIPGTRPEAIVLVHGINANRVAMLPTAALLAPAGYSLLLLDLRGHGESDSDLLTYGYREALDVQAAVEFLARQPHIDQIGAVGISMGGAAVARAAAIEPRLHAVVIQSSFSSLPAAVDDAFERFSMFPRRPFAPLLIGLAEWRVGVAVSQVDSARDLATLAGRPVLIIHGRNDQMFPLYHAETMFAAANQPKQLWIIEEADHGDPAVNDFLAQYQTHLLSFFADAFAR